LIFRTGAGAVSPPALPGAGYWFCVTTRNLWCCHVLLEIGLRLDGGRASVRHEATGS